MKKIICLDAGHGGKDSGALGPKGEREKDVTLSVVMLLGALLTPDFTVVYTRRDDTFVELDRRATSANDAGADAFLSIHCNSGPVGSGDGYEVYTTPGLTASDAMATDLFTVYGLEFPDKRKRMDLGDGDPDKEANFAVIRRTNMRAVLFELEFIHTQVGADWLTDPHYQARCAKALAAGLRRHFGIADRTDGTHGTNVALPALPDAEFPIKDLILAKMSELNTLVGKL